MFITSNVHVSEPPDELKYMKWCAWEWYWSGEKQKWTKPPIDPWTKEWLRTSEPDSWSSYEDVKHLGKKGYLPTRDDLICVIDLDGCRDPETGEIAAWAWKIIKSICSYTEVSPSGTGVHIIVYAIKPEDAKSRFNLEGHKVEVYDSGQYITFTGDVIDFYYLIRNGQDWLDEHLLCDTSSPNIKEVEELLEGLEATDGELTNMLLHAKHGDIFRRLFLEGDWSDFLSQSEADLRLCSMLSFATGGNLERIDRLFRSSALYRDKWERADYRDWTITQALDSTDNYYVQPTRYKILNKLAYIRLSTRWKKMSECFTYRALLSLAYKYGKVTDQGIEFYASIRNLSIYSGLAKYQIITQALRTLESMQLIILESPEFEGYANRIILIEPDNCPNITPLRVCRFCVPFDTPDYLYIKGLNHRQIFTLEILAKTPMSLDDLSNILGDKKNLKRRILKPLLPYLIEEEGVYRVRDDAGDWLDIDQEKLLKRRRRITAERDTYYGTVNGLLEMIEMKKNAKSHDGCTRLRNRNSL